MIYYQLIKTMKQITFIHLTSNSHNGSTSFLGGNPAHTKTTSFSGCFILEECLLHLSPSQKPRVLDHPQYLSAPNLTQTLTPEPSPVFHSLMSFGLLGCHLVTKIENSPPLSLEMGIDGGHQKDRNPCACLHVWVPGSSLEKFSSACYRRP